MKTDKERFTGSSDSLAKNRTYNRRGDGIEQMVRDEVADQVSRLLGSI